MWPYGSKYMEKWVKKEMICKDKTREIASSIGPWCQMYKERKYKWKFVSSMSRMYEQLWKCMDAHWYHSVTYVCSLQIVELNLWIA